MNAVIALPFTTSEAVSRYRAAWARARAPAEQGVTARRCDRQEANMRGRPMSAEASPGLARLRRVIGKAGLAHFSRPCAGIHRLRSPLSDIVTCGLSRSPTAFTQVSRAGAVINGDVVYQLSPREASPFPSPRRWHCCSSPVSIALLFDDYRPSRATRPVSDAIIGQP